MATSTPGTSTDREPPGDRLLSGRQFLGACATALVLAIGIWAGSLYLSQYLAIFKLLNGLAGGTTAMLICAFALW